MFLFLTIFPRFSFETVMILQNTSCLIWLGLVEVSTVKALVVAISYFCSAFKNNSDKPQLAAIDGIYAQSLSVTFAILTCACKHHVDNVAFSVSFPYSSHCRTTLFAPKEAENGVQTKISFYLRNTACLLIFVSPSGAVTGEIRTGLAAQARSLFTRACAEPQTTSWQYSSTCAFAYLHEVNSSVMSVLD